MNGLKVIGEINVCGKTIKHIEGGFGEGCRIITAKDIALEHEVELKDLNGLINDNITRFTENDLINLLKGSESLRYFAKENGLIGSNRTKDVFVFSEIGYRKLVNLMKNKSIGETILKEYFNSDEFNVFIDKLENAKEINFLNKLEKVLEPFSIKGIRQYKVFSYRIDYYISSLNIAIEYDENGHKNYTYDAHEGRQKEIEKELGCRFIRVVDKYSDEYNIGYVIKNIFNL